MEKIARPFEKLAGFTQVHKKFSEYQVELSFPATPQHIFSWVDDSGCGKPGAK